MRVVSFKIYNALTMKRDAPKCGTGGQQLAR